MNQKALLVGLLTAGLWEFGVRVFHVPKFLLPPLSSILIRMWAERLELLAQAVPTLVEIGAGYAIAVVVGFLMAVPIAYSRAVEEALFPILVTLQVIPKVALAPLFLVWLGFGLAPKITVAALIAFFPIVVNTTKGLRSVEQEMVQWMRTMGASPLVIFRKLSLPWALPYILAGMKVAIGLATVGAVTGEFIGTDKGLGYVILRSGVNMDTTYMFGGLIAVSVVGILCYAVVAAFERILLSWQSSVETPPETM
jgi:NitT/TauT family transport system permease protein